MSFSENTVIFSITNGNGRYPELAATWAKFLDELNISNYIIYCLDKKSFDYLNERGVGCELVSKKPQINYKPFGLNRRGSRLNKRFGLIAAYKLMIAKGLLERGKNVIYADTDAFFCSDPFPLMQELLETHDCLLSTVTHGGAYPGATRKEKGFTVCSGFFVLKASPQSVDFLSTLQNRLSNYSDLQSCINSYLSDYMTHRRKKGCAYSFLAGDLSVGLLPQKAVRRSRFPSPTSCVVHVTGPPKLTLDRASTLYKKLGEKKVLIRRREERKRVIKREGRVRKEER